MELVEGGASIFSGTSTGICGSSDCGGVATGRFGGSVGGACWEGAAAAPAAAAAAAAATVAADAGLPRLPGVPKQTNIQLIM